MTTATMTLCESCLVNGERTPATTHSINPDWSAINLCAECAAEYDSRPAVDARSDDDQ